MRYLIVAVLTACTNVIFAQKADVPTGVRLTPGADVPAVVEQNFRMQYPKAKADWTNLGDEQYEATFRDDSTQLPKRVMYSRTGARLSTHSRLERGAYPAGIDEYYLSANPTARFVVWRFSPENAPHRFYAVNGTDTVWFNDKGTLVRKDR